MSPENENKLETFEFAVWYSISSTTSVMKIFEGWLVRTASKTSSTNYSNTVSVSISTALVYVPEPHKSEKMFVERHNQYMNGIKK